MLKNSISECGINTQGLCFDPSTNTTLAFVHKLADGDRDFSFYRKPGADMRLCVENVQASIIQRSKIFHFGTLSMTHETNSQATRYAIGIAEANGLLRSFDPNLRPPLWAKMSDAKQAVRYGLSHCDILKISDNQIQWLTGKQDYSEGVAAIRKEFSIPLILVSMGPGGSRAYTENTMVEAPAFINANTIETTGAGDAFCGCILHDILNNGFTDLSNERLSKMLLYANAAASIVTTRRGALRMMPEASEIEACITQFHSGCPQHR